MIAHSDLATVNQQRFFIRTLIEQRINDLRKSAISSTYQETLFEKQAVAMCENAVFEIPAFYSPNKYYDAKTSKYGPNNFRHHYHGQIGEFDSKEEFLCAAYLDRLAEEKKIQCWLRNLSRGNGAFFLQKATDKFYPDFVCLLPDESILVVEYKGGDRWKEAEPDRLIGELWALLSNGRCHFIMVTNSRFDLIDALISNRLKVL